MIDIRANEDLSSVIQEECVRRMAVLRMRIGAHFSRGSRDRVGKNRPPNEEEKAELEDFARTMGLSGKFDVVADRVFMNTMSPGGMDVFREETEFHIFRRRDVPYLMSLKVALEVMGT